MKKSFSIITLFLIFIFSINTVSAKTLLSYNEKKACSNFYNAVKNDELLFLKGVYPFYKYDDFGFYIKRIWDSEKKKYISEKDKDGNLKVGEIYSMDAYNSIKTDDSIIKINDKKINNIDQFNKIYEEDIKKIKIELKDKNAEQYIVYLDKSWFLKYICNSNTDFILL